MTSEAPYLHCRLCGVRYRSDKVVDHERQCSYQNSNSRSSSRNVMEELAPVSSKDSGINELRDKAEYYMQATRSSKSSVNQSKDLKSNEESIDSPLNLDKGGGRVSREYHDEPTESHSRSEPIAFEITSTVGSSTSGQSKGKSPPNSISKSGEKSVYHQRSSKSSVNQLKDLKSNEESIDSPLNLDKGGGRVSREYHDEPTESPSRSEPIAFEIPSTVGSSTSGQSKDKSPPNSSSKSGEKSVHHQRSHSNEKTPNKTKPEYNSKEKASPQKSDEERKEAMMRTPYPSEEDIKIPSINAEEVGQAPESLENLPELSKHAEMAYAKHQKSLVPCTHCERTFRPDRLPIHERSCIERPKAREYIVPKDENKKNLN